MSVLHRAQLHPWRHPAPYDYHYGESHREALTPLAEASAYKWIPHTGHTDRDLAAHIRVTRERGVCLHGQPIATTFPPIPDADYIDALLYDYDDARDTIARNPVYSVLNLCRVFRFLLDNTLTSKDEGGAWGAATLPAPHNTVVAHALAVYRGETTESFDPAALHAFANALDALVTPLRPSSS
jgi:streptomycin 3"-adenylyltransferase